MPGGIDVLLIGAFHMANAGRDMGNVQVDDMLAEARQREIEAVVAALAAFAPTKVAVEYPVERQEELAHGFRQYCNGERTLGGDELQQLGFRTAREAGAAVVAIDVLDVFYDPAIEDFTARHPDLAPHLDRMWAEAESQAAEHTAYLGAHSVGELLRAMNSDAARQEELRPYIEHLVPIGRDDEYPGPEMAAYWYRRNLKIACNLFAAVADGDRVLVVYGAGHIPVLEHVLALMPSVRLVPTLDYLPR